MDWLWIEFVNSDWHDYTGREPDRDQLADAAWVREFVAKHGLAPIHSGSERNQAALREIRDLLMRCARDLVERGRLDAADLAAINDHLGARPVMSRIEVVDDACRLRLIPTGKALDGILFKIVESFASFLVDGDPDRLKLCENPDCLWVFYDTTRSRTRRWCADTCGNLMKVRKFREKARKDKRKKR